MNAPFATQLVKLGPSPTEVLQPLSERRKVRKAVILAAGRGRRMGKLTVDRPKGALEVGGHALIDWQIEALRVAGVEEIAIVTGHASDALAGRNATYIHNPDWAGGTQVETLLQAADWIGDEPVIVSYSDIIYHPCAPLALLERPGEIVIGYDADHRWLWKRRFGNWLRDSETFKLGPGQVLVEIGGKPTDIEDLDGQFMGLMLLTHAGLARLSRHFLAADPLTRKKLDFTYILSQLVRAGCRIDTAANLLPWIEVDSRSDLKLAAKMCSGEEVTGKRQLLQFPASGQRHRAEASKRTEPAVTRTCDGPVENVICIQNWGRSGSVFLQSLLDNHPQILSTPNFYSRIFYESWAREFGHLPDDAKIDAFLNAFRQWWDPAAVDTTANLHRLGQDRSSIAGVDRSLLELKLRTALQFEPVTRRKLFEAGHLAYAQARGQLLEAKGLRIVFPIHGEGRGVAGAILEDFPFARFVHTIRDPADNLQSSSAYVISNSLDERVDPLQGAVELLFGRSGTRYGRVCSVFGDRPYYRWLIDSDRVRAVRVEDLNLDRAQTISNLADWLGLTPYPSLLSSSFDGKKWWGGARVTVSGAQPSTRSDRSGQTRRSDRLARSLARNSSLLSSAYGHKPNSANQRFDLLLLVGTHFPWQNVRRPGPSIMQRLVAARLLRRIYRPTVRRLLDERIVRERYRCSLIEYNAGISKVREHLSGQSQCGTITAALIASGSGATARTRAIYKVDPSKDIGEDDGDAFFLSDALHRPEASEHLMWAALLAIGGVLARLMIAVQLRGCIVRRMLTHDKSIPMKVI